MGRKFGLVRKRCFLCGRSDYTSVHSISKRPLPADQNAIITPGVVVDDDEYGESHNGASAV